MPRSCPLGHTCEDCIWEVTIQGKNPQTGLDMDKTMCAMVATPMLLLENTKEQRGTAAAVESFRNEMVKANTQLLVYQRALELELG